MIAPTKSLRETASSTGRPSACSAGSARSTSTVCAGVLPKSGPGSRISCSNATPRSSASAIRSRGTASTSATTRPSNDGSSSFCFGAARVCMITSAGAGLGAHIGERRIAQAAHVVDDRRAGRDRRAGHRRLVRVDRHQRPEPAGDPLDQRHDPLDLLRRRHRRPRWSRRTRRRYRSPRRRPRAARARARRDPRGFAQRPSPRTSPAWR